MGFNAVLAAAGGARNYMARRQIDKRVSFLSYFGDLKGDISSYHCEPTTPITAAMLTSYSSYQLLSGATNITYVLPGLDLSGPFTIEGEVYHVNNGNNYLSISGHILLCCGGWGCALGDNVASAPQCGTRYATGYSHLAVTRNSSGLLCSYRNGARQETVSGNATNWSANKTLTLNTNSYYAWRYLRIISGICVGNGGTAFPVPASPYTGYEAL